MKTPIREKVRERWHTALRKWGEAQAAYRKQQNRENFLSIIRWENETVTQKRLFYFLSMRPERRIGKRFAP